MAKHRDTWNRGDAVERLPKAFRPFASIISSVYTEDDGCFQDARGRDVPGLWVELTTGLAFAESECGTAHEASISDVARMFERIELNQDGEVVMRALLTLSRTDLAILGDAIEEGRPVAAWEDGGPAPLRFQVKAQWFDPAFGGTMDRYYYPKAYTHDGAVAAARAEWRPWNATIAMPQDPPTFSVIEVA